MNIHWKDWCWSSNTLAPDVKSWLIRKDPYSGKVWTQEEKGMTEDKMVGWHHWLNGHEFEQALRVVDGQGSLASCSPWGHKELYITKQLNCTSLRILWVCFIHTPVLLTCFKILKNTLLFIWLCWVLVSTHRTLVEARGLFHYCVWAFICGM